jgi:hypothetical protein
MTSLKNIHYDEPVLQKDIAAEQEFAVQGMESATEFYFRLSHQGAPQALLQELAFITQEYKDIKERLERILPCFPRG